MNATTDWYEVDALDERSWLIRELDRYNAYLLEGDDEALLVDTGCGVGDIRGLVEGLTDLPVRLLLTHTHWDHIGNAAQFDDVLAHPRECTPEGTVAIDGLADDWVHRPTQALSSWREEGIALPDAFDGDDYSIDPVSNVEPVYPGDVLDLGNRRLELLALPGHSPGMLGVLDRTQKSLYGADLIGGSYRQLAHFSNADPSAYLSSVRLARDLAAAGAFDTLATGHILPISGDELDVLERLASAFAAVVAGDEAGTPVESRYGPATEYDFEEFLILTRR
jgi:glyoxylase-like metal-dependent hydrolase (beta-lactamase superfamily II)